MAVDWRGCNFRKSTRTQNGPNRPNPAGRVHISREISRPPGQISRGMDSPGNSPGNGSRGIPREIPRKIRLAAREIPRGIAKNSRMRRPHFAGNFPGDTPAGISREISRGWVQISRKSISPEISREMPKISREMDSPRNGFPGISPWE